MTKTFSGIYAVPAEIAAVSKTLKDKGFEAYLIGGCVRDIMIGRTPKDWDITTNAKPEDIIAAFPETFYENKFGTVGVVNKETTDETLKVVEITPYRTEGDYSDKRRPDTVQFSDTLEDDLKRRDFTFNAIALVIDEASPVAGGFKGQITDLYKGQDDLKAGVIKTVGKPTERFNEDALRMLRAVRLAAELGFTIEPATEKAILELSSHLKHVSRERVRDEFSRILLSDSPKLGLELCRKLGLIPYIAKELEDSYGVEQNQAHAYDVWEHLIRTLQHAADKKWPLFIRLAALFHDIAKPATRRWGEEQQQWTFYGHEVVGARFTRNILTDLKYPKETIELVTKLVRWHMFFSDTETITLSAVRRIIAAVGKDHIWDLMNIRICDRVGTGRPKENPYRLRKYKSMVEEALRDPISVGMLKIDGKRIMEVTHETPNPRIGLILHALLEEVLEDPKLNTAEYLEKRTLELAALAPEKLKELGEAGKDKKAEEEEKVVAELRKKHGVK